MDTTYPQKFFALCRALASSPRDIPAYLRHLPCWRRQPADLELPWFSYGAIRFLKSWLRPTHRVFEYGSGGSTLFFAPRVETVLAVENDAGWQARVAEHIRVRGLRNASVEFHPLANDELATFMASSFANRIRSGTWDVVVVDCHPGFYASRYGYIRPAAVELAMEQLNPHGIIVLDDCWMYPEQIKPRAGWQITVYGGCGPARYGVTATAVLQKL